MFPSNQKTPNIHAFFYRPRSALKKWINTFDKGIGFDPPA
jgi:hypothetical protein